MKPQESHHQILIIGGGTGGIMTAAQLRKRNKSVNIAIIEPSEDHYYQPAWTLVGGGTYSYADSRKDEAALIPPGVSWIKDKATALDPDKNTVSTANHGAITYEYLVIAPGLVNDYSLIEGLEKALDKGVVCSNYVDPEYTWQCIEEFRGGNALFTQPATPIKCGGAPQKIAYLMADYLQKTGLDKDSNVIFASPGSVIFGVEEIANTLMKVIRRYGIYFRPHYAPFKIDSDKNIAYFKWNSKEKDCQINSENDINEKKEEGSEITIKIPFNFLHLAPPQTAPAFIQKSKLANKEGWLDVDNFSLQHNTYDNIFGLGDVAALPTAKTGAAIRKQAPVVVDNILKSIHNDINFNHNYDGYSSCPLVTGYGKMVLAEFDYDNNFTPDPELKKMLVFNSAKEHWRLWLLKKYGLPYMYWKKMLRGEM